MPMGDETRLAQVINRPFKQRLIHKTSAREQDVPLTDAVRHINQYVYECSMKFAAYHRLGEIGVYIRHERCEQMMSMDDVRVVLDMDVIIMTPIGFKNLRHRGVWTWRI